MSAKLLINREDKDGSSQITIGGVIDEQSDFKDLFSGLKDSVTIDMNTVEMINSCGVREWLQAIKEIPKATEVHYENCPPRIVEQINYISNFLGHGDILSFYAPYYCPKEKKDVNVLLTPADIKINDMPEAPKQKCPDCKTPLEFEDVEEEYFSFLHNL